MKRLITVLNATALKDLRERLAKVGDFRAMFADHCILFLEET